MTAEPLSDFPVLNKFTLNLTELQWPLQLNSGTNVFAILCHVKFAPR